MYAGTTLTVISGSLLGAHQKIDRLARKQLDLLFPGNQFPGIKSILYFEGNNGPDAIKRKSPAQNEPHHFLQPFDVKDIELIDLIQNHFDDLVTALKKGDKVRASFEAAWLSHAVVDGLTPAHHYPFQEELVALTGGKAVNDRTLKEKFVMTGENRRKKILNNWLFWGPKGLLMSHAFFEAGVAMLLIPVRKSKKLPTRQNLQLIQKQGVKSWFRHLAQDVAQLELYDAFHRTGWNIPLARRVKKNLAPMLVQAVTIVWYNALNEADLLKATKKK